MDAAILQLAFANQKDKKQRKMSTATAIIGEKDFYDLLSSNVPVGDDIGFITDGEEGHFWSDYDDFVAYFDYPGSFEVYGTKRDDFELDKDRLHRVVKDGWRKFVLFDDFKSYLEDWINEDLICEFFPEDLMDQVEIKGFDDLACGLFLPNLRIILPGTIEKFNEANKHLWLWGVDSSRKRTIEVSSAEFEA